MTRFLAPRYFSPEQIGAVERALTELSIGDEEGVRIFIIALEYELAEYEKYASDQEPPEMQTKAPDPELAALSRDLLQALTQIKQLPAESRRWMLERLSTEDMFDRRHDQAYLDAVTTQLARIAEACVCSTSDQHIIAELGEAEKHFIGVLAEAYFECFETAPGKNGGEPFISLLQRVVEISGLDIPLEKSRLEPILSTIG